MNETTSTQTVDCNILLHENINKAANEIALTPGTLIEYIWGRDGYGNKNRFKKGVMLAAIDPTDPTRVIIGYMIVNIKAGDKYDYFDGKKSLGTGVCGAYVRAIKWSKIEWVKYYYPNNTHETTIPQNLRDDGDTRGVWIPEVKIPISFVRKMRKFLMRCDKYYKMESFPEWTRHIWTTTGE